MLAWKHKIKKFSRPIIDLIKCQTLSIHLWLYGFYMIVYKIQLKGYGQKYFPEKEGN